MQETSSTATPTTANTSISRLLDAFLANDVLQIETEILKKGFSVDEFEFDCPNPEKRIIPEIWATHKKTGYYFRGNFHDGLRTYQFRITPGVHHPNVQHKFDAHQKGPQFSNAVMGFRVWLQKVQFQIESRNKMSDMQGYQPQPLKDEKVYTPDKIEIIFDENDESEVSAELIQGLNQFTQWLLPQAEKEIGKNITQEQYDDLKTRVENLERANQPGAKKNVVGRLFKAVMEHEVLTFLHPYLHEYVVTPVWDGIKMYFHSLLPPWMQ